MKIALIVIGVGFLLFFALFVFCLFHWFKAKEYTENTEMVYFTAPKTNENDSYVEEKCDIRIYLTYSVVIGPQFVFKKYNMIFVKGLIKATIENTLRQMLMEYGLTILTTKQWFIDSLRKRINRRIHVGSVWKTVPLKNIEVTEIEMETDDV